MSNFTFSQNGAGLGSGIDNESGGRLDVGNSTFSRNSASHSDGKLEFTPAKDANGSATVTVLLKDDGGTDNGGVDTSATRTFTITLTPVNDAPTVALSPGEACSTSTTSVSATMNLSLADVDSRVGGSGTDPFDGGSGTDVATDFNPTEGDTRTNIP